MEEEEATAPIAVDRVQIASHPIVVRIDRYVRDLHVALMDSAMDEVAGYDVAPGERAITLVSPSPASHGPYAILATYTSNLGQETLVRPILFHTP